MTNSEQRIFIENNFLQRNPEDRCLTRAVSDPFLEYDYLPGADSKISAQNEENLAESYLISEKFEKSRECFEKSHKYFSAASFWEEDPGRDLKNRNNL